MKFKQHGPLEIFLTLAVHHYHLESFKNISIPSSHARCRERTDREAPRDCKEYVLLSLLTQLCNDLGEVPLRSMHTVSPLSQL